MTSWCPYILGFIIGLLTATIIGLVVYNATRPEIVDEGAYKAQIAALNERIETQNARNNIIQAEWNAVLLKLQDQDSLLNLARKLNKTKYTHEKSIVNTLNGSELDSVLAVYLGQYSETHHN